MKSAVSGKGALERALFRLYNSSTEEAYGNELQKKGNCLL